MYLFHKIPVSSIQSTPSCHIFINTLSQRPISIQFSVRFHTYMLVRTHRKNQQSKFKAIVSYLGLIKALNDSIVHYTATGNAVCPE